MQPGDQVGQAGVENTYDNVLRGINGMTRVQVDAAGQPTGGVLSRTQPQAGDNLLLSIDSRVQNAGQAAIDGFPHPGAFVAMNVKNGEILGLGSSPTYDPSVFTKPVLSQAVVDQVFSDTTGSPYTDRATQGYYPTGSTFKPITAVAALESGVLTPTTTIVDGGSFTEGGITLHNAGGGSYGALQLPAALQVSSDVFFYNVGADLFFHGNGAQQKWASDLGIGHPTGIDLPGEVAGLLPTPQWRNQLFKEGNTDRPWSEGDNVNLAVGQGDLQTNPLQMAVAYAAIANGGDVVRPHVGMEVEDSSGRAVQEIDPAPQRHLDIAPQYRQAILEGIHMAAQSPGGTSYAVFGNFPIPMAGKTGTAQRPGQADQSWYMALAPYPNPQVVVAATIEQGGFGVDSAAPVARQILDAYFNVHKQEAKAAGGKVPKQVPLQAGSGRERVRGEPVLMVSDAYPRPFDERRPAAAERGGLLGLDPLLLIAALGLIGFGIFTLGEVTGGDIPHDPYFYVIRQAIYAVIGVALMLALARVDYSRFRELRVGLYTAMIGSIILVLLLGQATRGSKRWIELPFFTFQPSELGKVLLIAALAGFAIDRGRRVTERQHTARILLAGVRAGGDRVHAARPWDRGHLRGDHARDPVRSRGALDALRDAGRAAGRRRVGGAGDRPGDRPPGPQGLPAGAADVVPQPELGPARRDVPDRSVADRDRVRQQDGTWSRLDADRERLRPRPHHRLHLLRRRRAIRLRRCCFRPIPLCPADLEGAAHHDAFEELVRELDSGRDRRDVHVPGVREHRCGDRNHAGDRHPVTVDELWRVVRRRHVDGGWPPAEHLRPGAAHLQEQGGSAPLSGSRPKLLR